MGRRLVRDEALRNWVVPGAEHQVRPVTDAQEHKLLLRTKLLEEAGEVMFAESRMELAKELADLLAVMKGMAEVGGLTWDNVLRVEQARDDFCGGFVRGMVWETSR